LCGCLCGFSPEWIKEQGREKEDQKVEWLWQDCCAEFAPSWFFSRHRLHSLSSWRFSHPARHLCTQMSHSYSNNCVHVVDSIREERFDRTIPNICSDECSAAPTVLPRQAGAGGITMIDTQPFRAGLTFGGRPSGPRRCDTPQIFGKGLRFAGPRSVQASDRKVLHGTGRKRALGLARTACANSMQPCIAGMTKKFSSTASSRPGGPSAKRQPSPGGLGHQR
jgi:hypothetical protein